MKTQTIRTMINKALNEEQRTNNLHNLLRNFLNLQGSQYTEDQYNETYNFIVEYIKHVPEVLDLIANETKKVGMFNQIEHILKAAEEYFISPVDVIPDHMGLIGLLDDAYLAHSLLQSISNTYHSQTGHSLMPFDMTQFNSIIRIFLGAEAVQMLDAGVASVLNMPNMQDYINNLFVAFSGFTMNQPDPIWGNASIEEITNTRLGAMGVI